MIQFLRPGVGYSPLEAKKIIDIAIDFMGTSLTG
jgi:hypothetical protein